MTDAPSAKAALRREMRAKRRALPDAADRSDRLWSHVRSIPAVAEAGVIMVFSSIRGEPVTEPFVEWCRSQHKSVVFPEDDPDPSAVDVVVVPGTAFTPAGDRLGQGGGWYDRFLREIRPDCVTIGVAFELQVVAHLPTEPHDVILDLVMTERGRALRQPGPPGGDGGDGERSTGPRH